MSKKENMSNTKTETSNDQVSELGDEAKEIKVHEGYKHNPRNYHRKPRHDEEEPKEMEIPMELIPPNAVDITETQCKKLWKVPLEGETDPNVAFPERGMLAQVRYKCWLLLDEDKTVFDSSSVMESDDEPIEFVIGNMEVIRGIDEGVLSMKKGEKALFICHFDFAYGRYSGQKATTANIPNKSFICTEVEVLNFFHDMCENKPREVVVEKVEIYPDAAFATTNAIMFVELEGYHEDNKFFPSVILPFNPVSYTWGWSETISSETLGIPEALEYTLIMLKEGEKAWVTLTGSSAYGTDVEYNANEQVVPAGATVKFLVRVDHIEELMDPFLLSLSEKVEFCAQLIETAESYVGKGYVEAAASKFHRVKEYLQEAKCFVKVVPPHLSASCDSLFAIACLNLVKLFGKSPLMELKEALGICNTGLLYSKVKREALFYQRGLLSMRQKEYEEAQKDFNQVLNLLNDLSFKSSGELGKDQVVANLKEARKLHKLQRSNDPLRYVPPK